MEAEDRKKGGAKLAEKPHRSRSGEQCSGGYAESGHACASVALALACGFTFSFSPGDSAIPPAQYRSRARPRSSSSSRFRSAARRFCVCFSASTRRR